MEVFELVRVLVAAGGIYLIARAVHRRVSPTAAQPVADRRLTRGLKALAACGLLALLAAALITAGYYAQWDRRVAFVAIGMLTVAAVIGIPLAAWIGWRAAGEEGKQRPD